MSKAKPILFSGPMVRALLAGTKTQTRRIMKQQPAYPDTHPPDAFQIASKLRHAPHKAGDEMWVRETWGHRGGIAQCGEPEDRYYDAWIQYKADGTTTTIRRGFDDRSGLPKMVCRCKGGGPDEHGMELQKFWASWRPSIFMPRWASRLTLTVTDVRVERLQDISKEDCRAEGCNGGHDSIPGYGFSATPREHYRSVWNSINGDGSWAANPYVWVYSFEVKR